MDSFYFAGVPGILRHNGKRSEDGGAVQKCLSRMKRQTKCHCRFWPANRNRGFERLASANRNFNPLNSRQFGG